eukprot:scaffold113394_cov17-Prasinocladus_malaysianus.AAC.3
MESQKALVRHRQLMIICNITSIVIFSSLMLAKPISQGNAFGHSLCFSFQNITKQLNIYKSASICERIYDNVINYNLDPNQDSLRNSTEKPRCQNFCCPGATLGGCAGISKVAVPRRESGASPDI